MCGTDCGEEKCCRVVVGKAKGSRLLGRTSVDGRIILKCRLKEKNEGGIDWIYLADDKHNSLACCACGIECGDFLEQLRNC